MSFNLIISITYIFFVVQCTYILACCTSFLLLYVWKFLRIDFERIFLLLRLICLMTIKVTYIYTCMKYAFSSMHVWSFSCLFCFYTSTTCSLFDLLWVFIFYRKLVQDLLESETDYVCDLRDLIENYFDVADEEFPDRNKGKDIFRNVGSLYQFHHLYVRSI